MTKNLVFHSRSKHIDIHHHFIRELVQQEFLFFFEFCNFEDHLADIFTKALPKDWLEALRSQLGILKLDITGEIEGTNAWVFDMPMTAGGGSSLNNHLCHLLFCNCHVSPLKSPCFICIRWIETHQTLFIENVIHVYAKVRECNSCLC